MFDSYEKNTINKKIACVTDLDPQRKDKTTGKYNKCYPFELDVDMEKYEYQSSSNPLVDKYSKVKNHPNIRCFSQPSGIGKTFEYELILYNSDNEILLTDSMSNLEEIKNLMEACKDKNPIDEMLTILRDGNEENERIKKSIVSNAEWDEDKKRKHIVAARYLNSVGKGVNALEISQKLEKVESNIVVPDYIKEAVEWICQ